MGCLSSQDENKSPKNDKTSSQLQLAPHVTMSTYDPGNLSITRPSVMKDYQFTKKQSTKNNGYRLKAIKSESFPNGQLKLRTAESKENQNDIEEHNKRYIIEKNITELNNINLLESAIPKPRKRIVFISIVQLNVCIDNIPKYILEESLFMFKAERAWFFPSTSTEVAHSKKSIRHRVNWNELFLQQLEKKDKLGHVLWFEDSHSWEDISLKLTQISDIYSFETIKYYKPLLLNEDWWINNYSKQIDNIQSYASHRNTSYHVILEEINACKLKFNPAMEIIYQSNPTLVPMKSFNFENFINQHYRAKSNEDEKTGSIMIPANGHCIQNSATIDCSEERSNKNLVENIETKFKKQYDMTALTPVESNTNANMKGMKMINQYSITAAPSNSIRIDVPTPLAERKSNSGDQINDGNVLNE